jgi:diketogulonate reductase-like aldo/keto reductase
MLNNNQLYTQLNTGATMPLLGLGAWDMYGKTAEQAVEWALEIGYRLIDTAAMYQNETEVGNAVRQTGIPRGEIFITTKVNNTDQGFDATLRGFDASMKKLNCEYIDLYLVHWPLQQSRKDTWLALEKLYKEGRVRAIGVANYLVPFLNELKAYASVVPAVNQIEFSPYLFLKNELDYCKQRRIQLQAYTPLVRGMRFNDPKLLEIAAKYDKSPAQIILRWAVQQGISTIPKSESQKRLRENFDIFNFSIESGDILKINNFNENFRVVEDPMDLF